MSYQLGIDLGTTYTAAAVCRATERQWVEPDIVTLGGRTPSVASVLFLGSDGTVLVGESAQRRAITDPDRVVREFKRRIGDETPLVVGDREHGAHDLAARLVRWVVDRVAEREGGPARRIAVTHPAAWGPHKKELFARALTAVGVQATFLAEPQAAALSYASAERVETGSMIAVYDLGGGTFDAAVVRKAGAGEFELLGRAEGIERLGGVDFDEAVLGHVRGEVGEALDALDPADEHAVSAFAQLRRECVEAKEALSADTEVTIPVLLPERRTSVRLVRSEFEAMIRGGLEDTVEALRRAVSSAGLTPADLSAVLLVGGSSRIPLVSQMVSAELGRPVAVDADPKYAIAMGAALAVSPRPAAPPVAVPPPVGARHAGPVPVPVPVPVPPTPPRGIPESAPVPEPRPPLPRPVAMRRPAQPSTPVGSGSGTGRGSRRPVGLMFGGGGILAVAAIAAGLLVWNAPAEVAETGGPGSSMTVPVPVTTSTIGAEPVDAEQGEPNGSGQPDEGADGAQRRGRATHAPAETETGPHTTESPHTTEPPHTEPPPTTDPTSTTDPTTSTGSADTGREDSPEGAEVSPDQ